MREKRAIPRPHLKIYKDGEEIGYVTSGTFSPSLSIGIGMGYVKKEYSKKETEIDVEIRGKFEKGEIVRLPFYKEGTVRK